MAERFAPPQNSQITDRREYAFLLSQANWKSEFAEANEMDERLLTHTYNTTTL